MARRLIVMAAVVGALALAPGCANTAGNSSFSSNPSSPSGTLAHGSISALIAGLSWSASVSLTATFDGHTLAITGADSVTTLALTVVQAGTPAPALTVGTYAIGASSPVSATLTIASGTTETFVANATQGFGSITIATLTATGASGTFLLTIPPSAGGAGSPESVTNGTFNVTF